MHLSKHLLRLEQKRLRAELPDVSEAVCAELTVWLEKLQPKIVLTYKAFGSEISLDSLTTLNPQIHCIRLPDASRISKISSCMILV